MYMFASIKTKWYIMASSPFNSVDDPKIDNVGNISGLNYKKNIYFVI